MPIIIQSQWYTKEQVMAEQDKVFVFGDNLARKGTGGQALACRGQPNTIGIVTKWDEKRNPGSYMYDTTLEINKSVIMQDFEKIFAIMRNKDDKRTIVLPADGLGTGLANLKENAPLTLQFIKQVTEYAILTNQINELDTRLDALSKELWPRGYFNYTR